MTSFIDLLSTRPCCGKRHLLRCFTLAGSGNDARVSELCMNAWNQKTSRGLAHTVAGLSLSCASASATPVARVSWAQDMAASLAGSHLLSSTPFLQATGFFPPDWCGPSGRPSVAFLLVGLGLMGYGGFCLAGVFASNEALRKKSGLTGSENPRTSRIACACGAVVFFVMGGTFLLGWFGIL